MTATTGRPAMAEPSARAATAVGPRGSAVSARLRIIGWIMLTTLVGLVAVVVTVRSSLLADVARQANADVAEEANEFAEFVAIGRDPETARPFTSTERLLTVYLARQYPGDDEELVGYLPRSTEYLALGRGIDVDDRVPYDLAGQGRDLLRTLVDAEQTAGMTDTPAGEMRWGRVDITGEAGDPGGALLIAEFTGSSRAAVDATIRLIALVALGGLLLTAGIAFVVAGRILAPLRAVRRAAAEITERDLTRRIDVDGRDDIAALAITFNKMLDRLEDAFAAQRRFVDDAGHELRTPITIIRGHLELMGDDPRERAATIALVGTELERMNRIVSDLLVLAKAERPDFLQPAPVDIAELTLEIDAKVQALAPRRWVLSHVADGIAWVDAQRVTQAVLQLAQNAVQHTGEGDEVRLASQFRGDRVVFSVIDTGPGVRADEVSVIFERFASGSAPERDGQRGGAGLGLAIVRAIADGHGGSAFVDSVAGSGATFGIELPVVAGGPRSGESEHEAPRQPAQSRTPGGGARDEPRSQEAPASATGRGR